MPIKIKTLETYFEQVWVKGNIDALADLLAPNARTRGIMGDIPFDAGGIARIGENGACAFGADHYDLSHSD